MHFAILKWRQPLLASFAAFTQVPLSASVLLGTLTVFTCTTETDADPTISWIVDGLPATDDAIMNRAISFSNTMVMSSVHSTLIVHGTVENNNTVVQCIFNEAASDQATLTVEGQ